MSAEEAGFSFNFFGANAAPGHEGAAAAAAAAGAAGGPPAEEAWEVPGTTAAQETSGHSQVDVGQGITLLKGCVPSAAAAQLLGEERVGNSDLLPNKYEGGFKLWEGALDLCRHLVQAYRLDAATLSDPSSSALLGKRVLELGCGHGLPGILCLLAGAQVHFQDYNEQVLTALTMPNVRANLAAHQHGRAGGAPTRYYAGDWQAVGQLLAGSGQGGYYDVVLAAETIYSPDSHQRLLSCMKQVLQPPHGVAYVAAKSYYFGVGGGTQGFCQAVGDDGVLQCERVAVIEDGASNKREVLKLAFPASIIPYFL